MGGATWSFDSLPCQVLGLSPRGRGNRLLFVLFVLFARSIPAWAGQPLLCLIECLSIRVYPRVGGATAKGEPLRGGVVGLSPRGRGNRRGVLERAEPPGSIPAWAGQPYGHGDDAVLRTVYPRVGGATGEIITQIITPIGLSPRGRGNPDPELSDAMIERSIPAWAGQP